MSDIPKILFLLVVRHFLLTIPLCETGAIHCRLAIFRFLSYSDLFLELLCY